MFAVVLMDRGIHDKINGYRVLAAPFESGAAFI
jgi:hypothetical protein